MALRKMSVYHKHDRPYTRKSRVKQKAFIRTIPPKQIVKFVMGNIQKYSHNKFAYAINLVSNEDAQIRDNAIEASRQLINRHLERDLGKDYYFAVSIYPHHILREHKMAAVAQSDRSFAGMKHAFGKPISLAAQVKRGSKVFIIAVSMKSAIPIIRKIYQMVRPKLGCKVSVVVEELKK